MERNRFAFAALLFAAGCLPSGNGGGGEGGKQEGTGGSGQGGMTVTGTGGENPGTGGVSVGTGGMNGQGGAGGKIAPVDAGTDTTTSTGNAVCDSVKQFLDGFEYLLPCGVDQSYSVLVCVNNRGVGGTAANEYLTQGTRNLDMKFTVAGPATQSCTVTLTVQGVVEPKHYDRCATNFGAADEGFASGPANGGSSTGCYPNNQGNYNVYMMHVSDSATQLTGNTLTGTRYFWNAINKNEAHFSYPINYTTPPITIKGGQTLWMLADDSNSSAIKNCATTSVDNATAPPGRCDPITVPNINPAPGKAIVQPYNGQFVLLHVASATAQ
jgi:hypothetical protein